MIAERRDSFAAALNDLSAEALYDAFANEILETGGTFIVPPADQASKGYGVVEISLHGVSGYGVDATSAMQVWRDTARRMCEAA